MIAMPSDTPSAIVLECRAFGAEVHLIDGLISDCGAFIAERAPHEGWFEVSTLKEPYRIEGKKTMGYELWEEFDGSLPDVIVYPTGGGVGLIGMWKAFEELEAMRLFDGRRPRMIAAQAEGCAPIVRAFERGAKTSEKWDGASTVASGLRVPKALGDFLILEGVYASGGEAVAASDAELMDACRSIARLEGIRGAGKRRGLAAIQRLVTRKRIARDESVVLFEYGRRISISKRGRPRSAKRRRPSAGDTPVRRLPPSLCNAAAPHRQGERPASRRTSMPQANARVRFPEGSPSRETPRMTYGASSAGPWLSTSAPMAATRGTGT